MVYGLHGEETLPSRNFHEFPQMFAKEQRVTRVRLPRFLLEIVLFG